MSARYPDCSLELPGVKRHHVPVFKDEDYTPISLAKKYGLASSSSSPSTNGNSGANYLQAYRDILLSGSSAFRQIFLHILTHPSRPLLFHCTAGKDRTGVFASLVLSLCDVDNEVIVADYAATTK